MPDLARHIVNQKAGHSNGTNSKTSTKLPWLISSTKKRAGKLIAAKARGRGENVVDLMDALRKSIGAAEPANGSKPVQKPRRVATGQKEMLMPIAGKKPAKEAAAKKPASKPQLLVGRLLPWLLTGTLSSTIRFLHARFPFSSRRMRGFLFEAIVRWYVSDAVRRTRATGLSLA